MLGGALLRSVLLFYLLFLPLAENVEFSFAAEQSAVGAAGVRAQTASKVTSASSSESSEDGPRTHYQQVQTGTR